jgi:hypothetical protein
VQTLPALYKLANPYIYAADPPNTSPDPPAYYIAMCRAGCGIACGANDIEGCMNPFALNYDPTATFMPPQLNASVPCEFECSMKNCGSCPTAGLCHSDLTEKNCAWVGGGCHEARGRAATSNSEGPGGHRAPLQPPCAPPLLSAHPHRYYPLPAASVLHAIPWRFLGTDGPPR